MGNWENDEKWAVFIQILRFFHQSSLISKGKHCLLSRHDFFDYNSTDFSQILEKKSGVGGMMAIGLRSFRHEGNECLY